MVLILPSSMSGYRTYIIATLVGLLAAAKFLGYVDEQTFQALFALLTGGGLATLRMAVNKP